MATAKSAAKAPWKRANPKPASNRKKLSARQKALAKQSAKKAGRRFPNLVDNMRAAKAAKQQ